MTEKEKSESRGNGDEEIDSLISIWIFGSSIFMFSDLLDKYKETAKLDDLNREVHGRDINNNTTSKIKGSSLSLDLREKYIPNQILTMDLYETGHMLLNLLFIGAWIVIYCSSVKRSKSSAMVVYFSATLLILILNGAQRWMPDVSASLIYELLNSSVQNASVQYVLYRRLVYDNTPAYISVYVYYSLITVLLSPVFFVAAAYMKNQLLQLMPRKILPLLLGCMLLRSGTETQEVPRSTQSSTSVRISQARGIRCNRPRRTRALRRYTTVTRRATEDLLHGYLCQGTSALHPYEYSLVFFLERSRRHVRNSIRLMEYQIKHPLVPFRFVRNSMLWVTAKCHSHPGLKLVPPSHRYSLQRLRSDSEINVKFALRGGLPREGHITLIFTYGYQSNRRRYLSNIPLNVAIGNHTSQESPGFRKAVINVQGSRVGTISMSHCNVPLGCTE